LRILNTEYKVEKLNDVKPCMNKLPSLACDSRTMTNLKLEYGENGLIFIWILKKYKTENPKMCFSVFVCVFLFPTKKGCGKGRATHL